MVKPIIEISTDAMNKLYGTARVDTENQIRQAAIGLDLQKIINTGISNAIKHTLNVSGETDPFSFIDKEQLLKNLEEFEEEPKKNLETIKQIASLISNEIFIEAAIHYCKRDIFDAETGEWSEQEIDSHKGVLLDDYAIKTATAIYVLSTVYHLLHSRKRDEIITHDTIEGTYTIKYQNDEWALGFTAAK